MTLGGATPAFSLVVKKPSERGGSSPYDLKNELGGRRRRNIYFSFGGASIVVRGCL